MVGRLPHAVNDRAGLSGKEYSRVSHAREKTWILVIAALGVVFGDIGTSPLYAVKVCFMGHSSIPPTPENVLGLVSLIFWSVMLVVSVKVCAFHTPG